MKEYFKCDDCGEIISEESIIYEYDSQTGCTDIVCPFCGSAETTTVNNCSLCDNPCSDTDEKLCEDCKKEIRKKVGEFLRDLKKDEDAYDYAIEYLEGEIYGDCKSINGKP